MIDLPDHDCFADTETQPEPHPPLWRAIVIAFLAGFAAVSVVGVGIVQGWW